MSEYIIDFQDERFTIEPVEHNGEIVRCRDCKCFDAKTEKWCRFEHPRCGVQWRTAEPDGFCAWAERRAGK